MARLALLLALYTGQRRSDVIRMGWKDIEDGFIKVRQEKTKAHLGIPIAPALAEAICNATLVMVLPRKAGIWWD